MTFFATRDSSNSALGGWLVCTLALGAMLNFAMTSAAWAQMGGLAQPGAGRPSPTPSAEPDKPPPPAPDAVPGAKARAPAAPATHAATELQPTDALFDAINRGDIAGARDALNRGADMDGINVLGMTPMELSVDLGRNDISFLLLSMRGEDTGRGSRAVGRDVAGALLPAKDAAPAKTTTAAKSATVAKSAARTKSVVAADASMVKPIAKPKLFANDGGAPMPSAGFLGFDPRSATN